MERQTETVKLYNTEDQLVETVQVPARLKEQPPRRIVSHDKTYQEGNGTDSYYGPGEFYEVAHG